MSSAVCAIVRVRWRSLLYHCVSVTRRTPFVCIACPQNIAPSEFHANGRLTLACVSSAVFIARGINAALEPVTPALLLKCRVPTSRTTLYQLLGFLLILPPPPFPGYNRWPGTVSGGDTMLVLLHVVLSLVLSVRSSK